MATKTPASILQEYMVGKQKTLTYNLIYSTEGTHEPLFKYQVSALGMVAIGSGKSKKEAKQEAAKHMLDQLEVEDRHEQSKEDSLAKEMTSCYSPYEDTIKDNAVGALQIFCSQMLLANPTYDLILDEGPAHFKSFTIRCTVSSLTTEATAHTKKQAKHRCSAAMIHKLKYYLNDVLECTEDGPKTFLSCEMARKTVHPGLPFSQIFNIFTTDHYFESNKLNELKNDPDKTIEEPLEYLKGILEEMNIELEISSLPTRGVNLVHLLLVCQPGWSFIGMGEYYDEALTDASRQALQFLIEMSTSPQSS